MKTSLEKMGANQETNEAKMNAVKEKMEAVIKIALEERSSYQEMRVRISLI
jgi:hypothetical protein